MDCNEKCCSLVRATIRMQEIDRCACDNSGRPLPLGSMIEVGSVSEFTATPSITTFTQTDFTSPTGGTLCRFDQIDSYDLAITMQCGSVENIILALSGRKVEDAAAPIVDESHILPAGVTTYVGQVIFFDKPIDLNVAINVDNNTTATPLVAGTDYELFGDKGIRLLSDASLNAGDELFVDYTTQATTTIQGLSEASKNYSIIIDGEDAMTGQKVFVRFYNVRVSPSSFSFIDTDTFKNIALTGSVLRNDCDTSATNERSYFDYRLA